jgi:hypothetical protein
MVKQITNEIKRKSDFGQNRRLCKINQSELRYEISVSKIMLQLNIV